MYMREGVLVCICEKGRASMYMRENREPNPPGSGPEDIPPAGCGSRLSHLRQICRSPQAS
jgi:hypothetical protein